MNINSINQKNIKINNEYLVNNMTFNLYTRQERNNIFEHELHYGHHKKNLASDMKSHVLLSDNNKNFMLLNVNSIINSIKSTIKFIQDNKFCNPLFVVIKHSTQNHLIDLITKYKFNFIKDWIPGILTNPNIVQNRFHRYQEELIVNANIKSKKLSRKFIVAHKTFQFFNYSAVPDLVIFSDMRYSYNAIMEAKKVKIPTIGLCDIDCSQFNVTSPIFSNDDSNLAAEYIFTKLLNELQNNRKIKNQ